MYSPDLQKLKNLGGYKMMNKHLQQIHFQKLIDVTISTVKRTPVAKIEVLSQGQSVTITITNPYNSTNGEKMTKNDIQKTICQRVHNTECIHQKP